MQNPIPDLQFLKPLALYIALFLIGALGGYRLATTQTRQAQKKLDAIQHELTQKNTLLQLELSALIRADLEADSLLSKNQKNLINEINHLHTLPVDSALDIILRHYGPGAVRHTPH